MHTNGKFCCFQICAAMRHTMHKCLFGYHLSYAAETSILDNNKILIFRLESYVERSMWMRSKVILIEMNFRIDSFKLDCNISILLKKIRLQMKRQEKIIFVWSRFSDRSRNESVLAAVVCITSTIQVQSLFFAFLFVMFQVKQKFSFQSISCHKSKFNHCHWLSIDM